MTKRPIFVLVLTLWIAPAAATGDAAVPMARVGLPDHVVNGITTSEFPSTVALIDPGDGVQFCTGTLIGCDTVLSAAHCVCETDGADCQNGGAGLLSPAEVRIFSQHHGFSGVASIAVPPGYDFGVTSDVAVLKLAAPVDGVAPTPINSQEDPGPGLAGTIVGFGLSRGDLDDSGLKRMGRVTTSPCVGVPAAPHVCWTFRSPLGDPGTDSNTCPGDSGGPLFLDFGSGPVVAGVTSGGISDDCLPFDEAWDANVFFDRQWILDQGGDDLVNVSCGDGPQAGESAAPIFMEEGSLTAVSGQRLFTVQVPVGAGRLRVALNGEEGSPASFNDFDLFLRAGLPASPSSFDCTSQLPGSYEVCELDAPAAGPWYVLVDRFSGAGAFQVTATVFGGEADPGGSCVASATTLCIDDQPGDRRFAITVDFDTAINGGTSGEGQAIPLASLGIRRGGLFWFFDVTNPELLIKVLNGCNVDGNYWVFWSAGTNVGLLLRVTDTATGRSVVYTNPDGQTAKPVTDTGAFSCN